MRPQRGKARSAGARGSGQLSPGWSDSTSRVRLGPTGAYAYDVGVSGRTLMSHPQTALETALRSYRTPSFVVIVAIPLVCWTWIVAMARDMYGPMTGASRWMMTPAWDVSHLFFLWAMWAVMMIGMMLPPAAPMILTYGMVIRRRPGGTPSAQIYALAAGYVGVWALFSVLATSLQRALASARLVSPMMEITSPGAGGVLLILAGVYQLTPLKRACLATCQSPLGFFMKRWREGLVGAFRMGAAHGLQCLGCCWALMLLLFVGGVMNLLVIAGLTALVAAEKLGLFGRHGTRISGALLVGLGVWSWIR